MDWIVSLFDPSNEVLWEGTTIGMTLNGRESKEKKKNRAVVGTT